MMKIENFKPFIGQHCETTATGSLLKHIGIELSEPMLFGLGEGLGFIFWNMKSKEMPFIGGRNKPDLLTQNICKHLNLKLTVNETSSKIKAWENVKSLIDNGIPVGLKLDCFHLEYFSNPIHFAGHYVAIYGYDNELVYLIDTNQQGSFVKTSLNSLALARSEKGAMSSKNLSYTISGNSNQFDLKKVIINAINNNAETHLNPPISNFGYVGISKTSSEILKWFNKSKNHKYEFNTTAMLMEKAGTGGALFRNLYKDFLAESSKLLQNETLENASHEFSQIGLLWTKVSSLFEQVKNENDLSLIKKASDILKEISQLEKDSMSKLLHVK